MHDDHDHDETPASDAASRAASPWLDRVNDAYYDRMGEGMGQRTRARINWMCAQCAGDSVLDVGCSQGITSILLGREGFRVSGIDIMEEAVSFARNELASEPPEVQQRVVFERRDLLSMPEDERFDSVILGEVVEHQTSAGRFLRAAARHVADGGRMVITVPFGLHPFPDHKCTVFPQDVVEALHGAFVLEHLEVDDNYIRAVARKESRKDALLPQNDRSLLELTQRGTEEVQARYFQILQRSRELQTVKKEQTERLKALQVKSSKHAQDAQRHEQRSLALQAELARSAKDIARQEKQLSAAADEVSKLRRELESAKQQAATSDARYQEAERMRGQLTEESAALGKRVRHMEDYRRRLDHQHATVKHWLADANAELSMLRGSISMRVGTALVSALRSPRDFIALPIRLSRLFVDGLRRRAARKRAPRASDDPMEADLQGHYTAIGRNESAFPVASLKLESLPPQHGAALIGTRATPPEPVKMPASAMPERLSDLRVAAIMDDFTRESFRHCCELRQITPEDWREELQSFKPHIVLVESAWKGENGSWARKVYPLSAELSQMVAWAREQGIPTAFWNKEDPVHYSIFLPTARLFDHVFTTDIDCIKSYRAELGHERVHLLPFACEPQSHNPLEKYSRRDGFCFAGSYYAKYPERQKDFASIIDALAGLGPVDIYDRNHGVAEESLAFPVHYHALIRGNLPYDQIDRAYKGYRYGVNINTVKQSQSMFARRAFDLLASNTVTISNFSRGLRLMFGDLIISSDEGSEVRRRLEPLMASENAYRKFRLQGLRKVLREHTYEDRLAFVVARMAHSPLSIGLPGIVVLAKPKDAVGAARILAAFERQSYADKRLVLIASDGNPLSVESRSDITVLDEAGATQQQLKTLDNSYVAVFSDADYYGENYLTDLVFATRYSKAAVIGKGAYYESDGGHPDLRNDGRQYRDSGGLPWRSSIVAAQARPDVAFAEAVASADELVDAKGGALAIDEFNYCRGWGAPECPVADDMRLRTGIELARLQAMVESADAKSGTSDGATLKGFGADGLAQLFPSGPRADGRIELKATGAGIEIASTLSESRHAYVYAGSVLPIELLMSGEIGRFYLSISAETLVSITLIFLDEGMNRVGHIIRACNSNQSFMPLEGTRYVRLGLRVQGAGMATMKRLVLQHVPPDIDSLVGSNRHLVVSASYPSYGNLYSYAFVHKRALEYRAQGLDTDVFRLDGDALSYEEFEGVDVASGSVGDLELMLSSNRYETILVHSFDQQIWSAIQPHLDSARVVVWIHGAEIQPWYRRDFNYTEDQSRQWGIQRSDMRMTLWRQVLDHLHPNLHFVFVSDFLAHQAMQDLNIDIPPSQYSVIHNFVDGDFFEFRPKPVEQRLRILSIRPYTKPTYANDLAVEAILDLAGEPWFDELSFTLVGDGPLFDSLVEPLRQFGNVQLVKRFLTQEQIRALHREHGVFLVPSRIDSQGVSRDEAMASGLVSITNAVSAIPEFVNDAVAILAPAEDWRGLADGIRRLRAQPGSFAEMSAAAAAHVRKVSGRPETIVMEAALVRGDEIPARHSASEPAPRRAAVYADLNLNLIDGSSIWASSLVQLLAGETSAQIDLILKARIRNTQVLRPLLDLPNVRLIEPRQADGASSSQPAEAIRRIVEEDSRRHYDLVFLRGFRVCQTAAEETALAGRLAVYMTDIPQERSLLDEGWIASLSAIASASRYLLCQTPALQALIEDTVQAARHKTRLLPPMVPEPHARAGSAESESHDHLRIVYAGKFAPLWGIREMLDAADRLAASGHRIEWHVFGDKIHNPVDDPEFKAEVRRRLEATKGVIWHRGVARAELMEALPRMDLGWAWRHASLEDHTLELSTKTLEYGINGVAALMAPGSANIAAFGEDYPLYARTLDEIVNLLAGLTPADDKLAAARQQAWEVSRAHGFDQVRTNHVLPLLSDASDKTVAGPLNRAARDGMDETNECKP